MFIAHLPAGYLVHRAFPHLRARALMVGSVLPDLDLLLVYGVGIWRHHHEFLTHRPALWLLLLCLSASPGIRALALGALVHMALDTMAGRIDWAWPWATFAGPLIRVPARYGEWIWNFVLHPVFGLELVICTAAIWLWRSSVSR